MQREYNGNKYHQSQWKYIFTYLGKRLSYNNHNIYIVSKRTIQHISFKDQYQLNKRYLSLNQYVNYVINVHDQ